MVPRGADAVVMVEHTEAYDRDGNTLIEVRRPAGTRSVYRFCR
jgi:molybdopterin biosynthesis enzyme